MKQQFQLFRELHGLAKAVKTAEGQEQIELKSALLKTAELMGLLQQDPAEWFYVEAEEGELTDAEVDQLVADMQTARAEKNYAQADDIRAKLTEQNITLTREGWRRG